MAGTGVYLMVGGAIAVVAQYFGFELDQTQLDNLTAIFLFLFGQALAIVGTMIREDLTKGIKRKTPLE